MGDWKITKVTKATKKQETKRLGEDHLVIAVEIPPRFSPSSTLLNARNPLAGRVDVDARLEIRLRDIVDELGFLVQPADQPRELRERTVDIVSFDDTREIAMPLL